MGGGGNVDDATRTSLWSKLLRKPSFRRGAATKRDPPRSKSFQHGTADITAEDHEASSDETSLRTASTTLKRKGSRTLAIINIWQGGLERSSSPRRSSPKGKEEAESPRSVAALPAEPDCGSITLPPQQCYPQQNSECLPLKPASPVPVLAKFEVTNDGQPDPEIKTDTDIEVEIMAADEVEAQVDERTETNVESKGSGSIESHTAADAGAQAGAGAQAVAGTQAGAEPDLDAQFVLSLKRLTSVPLTTVPLTNAPAVPANRPYSPPPPPASLPTRLGGQKSPVAPASPEPSVARCRVTKHMAARSNSPAPFADQSGASSDGEAEGKTRSFADLFGYFSGGDAPRRTTPPSPGPPRSVEGAATAVSFFSGADGAPPPAIEAAPPQMLTTTLRAVGAHTVQFSIRFNGAWTRPQVVAARPAHPPKQQAEQPELSDSRSERKGSEVAAQLGEGSEGGEGGAGGQGGESTCAHLEAGGADEKPTVEAQGTEEERQTATDPTVETLDSLLGGESGSEDDGEGAGTNAQAVTPAKRQASRPRKATGSKKKKARKGKKGH